MLLNTYPAPAWGFPVAQMVKNPPAMQETPVRALGGEEPLEKRMGTHASILLWRTLWTEENGRVQSLGSQRVGRLRDWHCCLCKATVSHYRGGNGGLVNLKNKADWNSCPWTVHALSTTPKSCLREVIPKVWPSTLFCTMSASSLFLTSLQT